MLFFNLPIIKSVLSRLDRDIASIGLQKAFARILANTKTKVIVKKQSKNLDKILKDHPVLLIANHPFEIEPLLLFATMPERQSSYIVANHQFLHFSKNLAKHIIPVYIRHNTDKYTRKGLRVRFINTISKEPRADYLRDHKKNIKSLKKASDKISKNNLVIIFPKKETGGFYPGIGHIIRQIKTDQKVYLIKAYIQGTSKFDSFRIFPMINRFFPSIKITYSKPKAINHLIGKDGKAISAKLFVNYDQWAKSIQKE